MPSDKLHKYASYVIKQMKKSVVGDSCILPLRFQQNIDSAFWLK